MSASYETLNPFSGLPLAIGGYHGLYPGPHRYSRASFFHGPIGLLLVYGGP